MCGIKIRVPTMVEETAQMRKIIRIFTLKPLMRRYVIEAAFRLLAARIALRTIPFRRLTTYFERPAAGPEASYRRRRKAWEEYPSDKYTPERSEISAAERSKLCAGIPWIINEAAALLPGNTACFARAIAAQGILRRLGVATTLHYGAATLRGEGLCSHVWLQDGEKHVIGYDPKKRYRVLARYPGKIPAGKESL